MLKQFPWAVGITFILQTYFTIMAWEITLA